MKGAIGIIFLVVAAVTVFFCTYTVKEWEQALVLQFGSYERVVNPQSAGDDTDAGLKFKAPWENVITMERRTIALDVAKVTVLDSQRKPLEVDSYVLYEITDPLKYFQALGNSQTAEIRLVDLMDSSLRGVLAKVPAQEIISGRRAELMNEIKTSVNAIAQGNNADGQNYGVVVTDVRIQRVELPQDVETSVFGRMISERNQEAQLYSSEGEKLKNEIVAEADKDAAITVAEAQGRAQTVRGEGDAESNAIYANAYNVDPEFFAFYRTMESYRRGIKKGTSYILSPDSDFLSYLDNQNPSRRR